MQCIDICRRSYYNSRIGGLLLKENHPLGYDPSKVDLGNIQSNRAVTPADICIAAEWTEQHYALSFSCLSASMPLSSRAITIE